MIGRFKGAQGGHVPKCPTKFSFCKNKFWNELANSLGCANTKCVQGSPLTLRPIVVPLDLVGGSIHGTPAHHVAPKLWCWVRQCIDYENDLAEL